MRLSHRFPHRHPGGLSEVGNAGVEGAVIVITRVGLGWANARPYVPPVVSSVATLVALD